MSLTTPQTYVFKGSWWSPEREFVELPTASNIVNEGHMAKLLVEAKKRAQDKKYIDELMDKAYEFSTLKNMKACELKDEYVQGLSLPEVAAML